MSGGWGEKENSGEKKSRSQEEDEITLKLFVDQEELSWEVPGCPVVRTLLFHCQG